MRIFPFRPVIFFGFRKPGEVSKIDGLRTNFQKKCEMKFAKQKQDI